MGVCRFLGDSRSRRKDKGVGVRTPHSSSYSWSACVCTERFYKETITPKFLEDRSKKNFVQQTTPSPQSRGQRHSRPFPSIKVWSFLSFFSSAFPRPRDLSWNGVFCTFITHSPTNNTKAAELARPSRKVNRVAMNFMQARHCLAKEGITGAKKTETRIRDVIRESLSPERS